MEVRPNSSDVINSHATIGVENWMADETMGIVLISFESLA